MIAKPCDPGKVEATRTFKVNDAIFRKPKESLGSEGVGLVLLSDMNIEPEEVFIFPATSIGETRIICPFRWGLTATITVGPSKKLHPRNEAIENCDT